MRKVDIRTKRALFNKETKRISANTKVVYFPDLQISKVFLHYTAIVHIDWKLHRMVIQTGGYSTPTTKARLNAMPNVEIYQKDFVWYLNGEAWNGERIAIKL